MKLNLYKYRTPYVLSVVAALASLAFIPNTAQAATLNTTPTAGRRPSDVPLGDDAKLVKVLDGETIQVTIKGVPATVKYIGLNTPVGKECYSQQATAANTRLIGNQNLPLRLEKDELDTDENGNLLRYVYLLDGRMVNEELAGGGFARAEVARPNIKNLRTISDFELKAIAGKVGGWARCGWQTEVAAGCPVLPVEQLMWRVETLPEIKLLRDGNCATISKAENPAGPAWSGEYIYHPVGSTISLGKKMYIRWKDGFVALEPGADGSTIAHLTLYNKRQVVFPEDGSRPFLRDAFIEKKVAALVRDPGNNNIVRIPNNAWLFREAGNNTFTTLVDVFEYKSGEFRIPDIDKAGYVL